FKELKNKQVIREEAFKAAQEIVGEKTVVEQEVNMVGAIIPPETEKIQSSSYNEEMVTSGNRKPFTTLTIGLNKKKNSLVNSIMNRGESDQMDNKMSHDQQTLTTSMTKDIVQPMVDNRFTKVTYIKKKDKKDKRILGSIQKPKTLQQ
ncbi:32475_t:CDS:2, partial [Gigaspora margarita]